MQSARQICETEVFYHLPQNAGFFGQNVNDKKN